MVKRTKKYRGGRKHRRKKGGRRMQRGGACGCPKVRNTNPLPPAPWEPPGGMYQPGKVNGLTGGYYYGINVDQSLPDPASLTNLGQAGGNRRRRKRKCGGRRVVKRGGRRTRRGGRRVRRGGRHTRRGGKRTRRRISRGGNKKRTRRRGGRRRKRGGRRGQRGGGFVMKAIQAILPQDILDVGYGGEQSAKNMYAGYVGAKPYPSPKPTNQPIDQKYKILQDAEPINVPKAYLAAANKVNTVNTPCAQQDYSLTSSSFNAAGAASCPPKGDGGDNGDDGGDDDGTPPSSSNIGSINIPKGSGDTILADGSLDGKLSQ